MTWIWRIPEEYPEEWMGIFDELQSPDALLLRKGEVLVANGKVPTIRFEARAADLRYMDVLPNSAKLPLVAKHVIDALEPLCAADFEAIPAVVYAAGVSLPGFCVVNILSKIGIIDLDESKVRLIPGTNRVMKFRRLALRPQGMGAHDLARDPAYSPYLFVSDRIREMFSRSDWKACEFMRPEDVRP